MKIKVDVINKVDGRQFSNTNEESLVVPWMKEQIRINAWGKPGEYDITVTKLFKGLSFIQKVKLLFDGEKVVEFNPSTKLLNESVK